MVGNLVCSMYNLLALSRSLSLSVLSLPALNTTPAGLEHGVSLFRSSLDLDLHPFLMLPPSPAKCG